MKLKASVDRIEKMLGVGNNKSIDWWASASDEERLQFTAGDIRKARIEFNNGKEMLFESLVTATPEEFASIQRDLLAGVMKPGETQEECISRLKGEEKASDCSRMFSERLWTEREKRWGDAPTGPHGEPKIPGMGQ